MKWSPSLAEFSRVPGTSLRYCTCSFHKKSGSTPSSSGVARVASLGGKQGCDQGKDGTKKVWPG